MTAELSNDLQSSHGDSINSDALVVRKPHGHQAVIHRSRRRAARTRVGIAGGQPCAAGVRQGDGECESLRGAGALSGHALDHGQTRGAVAVFKHDRARCVAVLDVGEIGCQRAFLFRHRDLDNIFRRVVDIAKRVFGGFRHPIAVDARIGKADASEGEVARTGARNARQCSSLNGLL